MKRTCLAVVSCVTTGLVAAVGMGELNNRLSGGVTPSTAEAVNEQRTPASLCFLPGTPGVTIARFERAAREFLGWPDGSDYNHTSQQWGAGDGTPVSLTWSVPADGLNIPSQLGENGGPNNINAQMTSIWGSVENGKTRIRACFDRWEFLTGIDWTEVSDDNAAWGASGPFHGGSNRGDVRIVMKNFGPAWDGVLAFNFFPGAGDGGDMVMNSRHANDFAFPNFNYRLFRNTVSHENGHGIGLLHVCPMNETKLMEPAISLDFDTVQHDEIRGGQRHYGDRFEANDSSGAATDLGSINHGGSVQETDISIDDNSDADFFEFTVPSNSMCTIVATPVGRTYQDWDQLQNGACANSGPTVNSLTIHDLVLQVRDSDGATVLLDQNSSGIGVAETVSNFVLPPSAGPYFVRVVGGGANEIQLYNIRVDVDPAPSDPLVCPSSFTRVRGIGISGDENSLCEDDGDRLVTRPDTFQVTTTPPVQIEFVGASADQSPSEIEVHIQSHASVNNIQQRVQLFNYDTQQWEQLNQSIMPTSDGDTVINVTSNAGRFVEGGTGEMMVRTQYVQVQFNILPTWQARQDVVTWLITP